MNLVERLFADLTANCVCTGSSQSLAWMIQAIMTHFADHSANLRPYRWTAHGNEILVETL